MKDAARDPLDRLFRPRSVALIGASSDPKKIAARPLRLLRDHGFDGDIWPVNPRADSIDGVPCFPDIGSLPGPPDAAMVLVGSAHAEDAVRALGDMGTGGTVALAGGYAEVGAEGIARQQALVEAAGGMRLLGPNTIGLVNMTDGITLSASGALDAEDRFKGGVAVVSQSGGILGALLSRAADRGVGLSLLAATGNEADIEVADLVAYLANDPATKVIALYLETLRRPDRFRDAAAEAARRNKALVVYKVGRSEAGAGSVASHTGALAGEDRFYDALFAQTGAIRVDRFSDLIDVPMGLSTAPALGGKRLAILTTTGGAAGLVADVCGIEGFETPPPGEATAGRLGALLQADGFVPDRNPVDLTLAGLDPDIILGAVEALVESPDYDAVIPIVGSSGVGQPRLMADPVIAAAAKADKPIVVYTNPSAPAIIQRLNAAGVPAYESPEACAAVLAALIARGRLSPAEDRRASDAHPVPPEFANRSGPLNETEAKRLFAAAGIPSVLERVAVTAGEAAAIAPGLGDEVVVKLLSRDVAHKTEFGGVRVGVPVAGVAQACVEIAAAARVAGIEAAEGILLQERLTDGIEMILGFARDPQLGPAVLVGAGGTLAELYDDTAIRLLPIARADAEAMLDQIKISTVLRGYRGRPPRDIEAVINAVLNFADLCGALSDRLVDAEINPLFVLPAGQGVKAADGVVVFAPSG